MLLRLKTRLALLVTSPVPRVPPTPFAPTCSVPPLISVAPLYVLAPVSTQVPLLVLLNPSIALPPSPITPATVPVVPLPPRIRFALLPLALVTAPARVSLPLATTTALSPCNATTPWTVLLPAWFTSPVALLLTKNPRFAARVTSLEKPIVLTFPALVATICLVPLPNELALTATTAPLLTFRLAVKVFTPLRVTVPPSITLTPPVPTSRLPIV